jgi:integrase
VRQRQQNGQITRIGGRWYVRYWDRRNVSGEVERKRVTHELGPVTTRGKRPPAEIVAEAARHMRTVTGASIPPERVVTVGDFVERIYLPWVDEFKRPSTAKGYKDIWNDHLRAWASSAWLKDVKTFHAQGWLNSIGESALSRNTLKHVKSVVSAIFKLAKQLGYFEGENPARDVAVNPSAAAPKETYAYSLEEINGILSFLPEPAGTAFAVAAFTGLRQGEVQGLRWEDYKDGGLNVTQSVWNGHIGDPKTEKSKAAIPVIKQLARRLELHRLRAGHPAEGPMFRNRAGKPMCLGNAVQRDILPALAGSGLEWHGWHACRRGLATNLKQLGVDDLVIQRILRHSSVSVTQSCYIKARDVAVDDAMAKLENRIRESSEAGTNGTLNESSDVPPTTIQ